MQPNDGLEKRIFRIDSIRQSADGVFQPFIESVFLIIAINYFAVGDQWKGLIASAGFIGFLLSAPLTGALNRTEVPRSRILFTLTALCASATVVAVFALGGVFFAVAAAVAGAAFNIRQPFFTDLYGSAYPPERRARRISLGLRLLLVVSLGTGLIYGRILEVDLSHWRLIFLFAGAVMAASALLLLRLPRIRESSRSEGWWQAMALPFRNPVFLYVQAAWMFVGFGNLWTLPLRAVYLAEERRGLGLSPVTVTLILVAIPAAVKLTVNPLWARLYHRLSFPALRIAINVFFLLSTPLFFLTGKLWVIILAAVLYGIGTSGSPFIWQLWVTRIVRPEEARIYQSAHAFLAGVRGILAPFVGFAVLQGLSFRSMGFISGGLSMVAILMMIPLLRSTRSF